MTGPRRLSLLETATCALVTLAAPAWTQVAPASAPPGSEEALRLAQQERQRSGDRRSQRVRMEQRAGREPGRADRLHAAAQPERLSFTVTLDGRTAARAVAGPDVGGRVRPGCRARLRTGRDATRSTSRYPWHGAHATAVNRCRGARVTLTSDLGQIPFTFEVRVFDDGVAYRHVVPGAAEPRRACRTSARPSCCRRARPSGPTTSTGTTSRPTKSAASTTFSRGSGRGRRSPSELPQGGYGSITEANLVGYAGMALEADGRRGFVVGLGHRQPLNWPFELRYGRDEAQAAGASRVRRTARSRRRGESCCSGAT